MMVLDKIVLADKLLIDLSIEFKYKDQELLLAKLQPLQFKPMKFMQLFHRQKKKVKIKSFT